MAEGGVRATKTVLIVGHSQVAKLQFYGHFHRIAAETTNLEHDLVIKYESLSGGTIAQFRDYPLLGKIEAHNADMVIMFMGSNDLDVPHNIDYYSVLRNLKRTAVYIAEETTPLIVMQVEIRPSPRHLEPEIYNQRRNGFNKKLRKCHGRDFLVTDCPVQKEEFQVDGIHFTPMAYMRLYNHLRGKIITEARRLNW